MSAAIISDLTHSPALALKLISKSCHLTWEFPKFPFQDHFSPFFHACCWVLRPSLTWSTPIPAFCIYQCVLLPCPCVSCSMQKQITIKNIKKKRSPAVLPLVTQNQDSWSIVPCYYCFIYVLTTWIICYFFIPHVNAILFLVLKI